LPSSLLLLKALVDKMGALGGALIAKGVAKMGSNLFGGRPVFSGMNPFARSGSAPRQSTQQYGSPTPLPTTPFSFGGDFSGKPFGNAPLGTGTFAPGNTGQGVSVQQPKSGLGSMLSGVGDAFSGAVSGVGNLFNGLGGGAAGSGSAPATPATASQPKSGLTGSQFGTGQENPNGEGVSADWQGINIDGVAGPDLFGSEIYNAAK
jgi:hypothetical protein